MAAPEICGDGLDNDADGFADNGCNPQAVTGICESPLSCRETGAVAPLTGQLVYREPADLAPRVPYGPSITLQRSFMSKYDPGNLEKYRAEVRPGIACEPDEGILFLTSTGGA